MNRSRPDDMASSPAPRHVVQLGLWTSILTAVTTTAALVIAVTLAPARSGPNCPPLVNMGVVESCVTYPYTDVAAYVPTEYIWMYPATLLALLFVVLVTSIHECLAKTRPIFSRIALAFAGIAAAVHTINYSIQIAVVQPSLVNGELEGLALFSQYNPHGIFIALEDLGYLMMGIAFLFVAVALDRRGKLVLAIKATFLIGAVLTVGGLIVQAWIYGFGLEYRYEVLSLTVDWVVLIVAGAMLSVLFGRSLRTTSR